MVSVSYWETAYYQMFIKLLAERRQELLEDLAAGVDYENYIKALGHLNGLQNAADIATQVIEKMRSSNT